MATFYLDYEGGNDANAGTSFATRWKTITNGATSARIAAGDTIRIMGSPAPTSLGINGTWTSGVAQNTKSITGATNASPIVITCTSHGYSTGDLVSINAVGGNTAANGVWDITVTGVNTFSLDGSTGNGAYTSGGTARQINSRKVTLASAVTATVASTGPRTTAWTSADVTNVTTSLSAVVASKEHYQSDSIAVGAGFTTGLAAYFATGTLNLSGYQQLSFWIYQSSGTIGALGSIDLRLCSDTAGTTAVNTFNIPAIGTTGQWQVCTVDLGTNLGNSIQSIAFYVNTDNGAQTFLLNNIIACKASSAADSLTLSSLIGKNTSGETWWAIQSIKGTRVLLDGSVGIGAVNTSVRGYYGTSETVTTWKRETIKTIPGSIITTAIQTTTKSGAETLPIIYSGGWDRTSMSTQNLETWFDGQNGNGYGISNPQQFITIEKLSLIRYYIALYSNTISSSKGQNFSFVSLSFNSNYGAAITLKSSTFNCDFIVGNSTGFSNQYSSASTGGFNTYTLSNVISNYNSPILCGYAYKSDVYTFNAKNNAGYAITISSCYDGPLLLNCTTIDNSAGSMTFNDGSLPIAKNCLFNESNEINTIGSYYPALYSQDHDQISGNHKIFVNGGLISAATDQRYNPSGISWKLQPTSTTTFSALRPLMLSLAKVACNANLLVTIKTWMRRDNTGLTMNLVCRGGQIAGVTNTVTSSMTAAANTWEEVTITFTPTETGVVEITAEAYGGTTYSGWVDSMTISQA